MARYSLLLEVPCVAMTDAMDAGVIRTYVLTSGPSAEGNSSQSGQIP
jgi:hypothetical protein